MTTQELRELDAWIAFNVMKWGYSNFYWWNQGVILPITECPRFTTDPAAAMAVLKKCAEKCQHDVAIVSPVPKMWKVGYVSWDDETILGKEEAETLELAICLFAKALFEQKETK